MGGKLGRIGRVGKTGIYRLRNKKGEGRKSRNIIDISEIPRKVYYHLEDKPGDNNYPLPTFIFAYAEYAAVDAIFRALVGFDNDQGIARSFTIEERLNEPLMHGRATFLVEVVLMEPHRNFLSMGEVCKLMEHLMLKYGRALTIDKVSLTKIYNI